MIVFGTVIVLANLIVSLIPTVIVIEQAGLKESRCCETSRFRLRGLVDHDHALLPFTSAS